MILAPLLLISVLFALNIGGSGLAPAFGVVMGANLIRRRTAVLLYIIFVVAGALLLGKMVAKTLGNGLIPGAHLTATVTLCVLGSATAALWIANLLHIPQSTSWVTVFSIAAAGLALGDLKSETITHTLIPAWILLPALSFAVTGAAAKFLYPMRRSNMAIHEYLARHERVLRVGAILTSCYVALSIGSNNVANVVGPLTASGAIPVLPAFLLAAPLVGLGAIVFPSPSRTVGTGIVPVGLLSASITNLVTGSIILTASWLGIPQSLVHINTAAVAAVSLVKEADWAMMRHGVFQKFGILWLATPMIAAALCVGSLKLAGALRP